MKVLISIFQVLVMVLVVLFVIGVLEVVSYRTVNKPLAQDFISGDLRQSEMIAIQNNMAILQEEHWTIRVTTPWRVKPLKLEDPRPM